MSNLRAICLMPLICLITLGISCTTTGDPAEVIPPPPTELTGTVGAAGGTLTSSNGLLSITIPAGALAVDTGIGLGEIELTEIDPAFGVVTARAALELLPVDLTLAFPAEITYSMSISTGTAAMSQKLPAEDVPEAADFIIGFLHTPETVRVPNQLTHYNIKLDAEKNVKSTIEVEKGGQIIYASPLESLGSLGQFAVILGPDDLAPSYVGTPTSVLLELTIPDGTFLDIGGTYFKKDPETPDFTSEMLDYQPWDSGDTTILDDNRIKCPYLVDMVPGQEGPCTVGAMLGGNIVWFDPDQCAVLLGETPDIGDIDFTIEVPTFTQQVELRLETDLTIRTGMTGLKDLAVAFGTINDPAPMGEPYNRWLYVMGSTGVKYYRVEEDDGMITAVTFLDSIYCLDMEGMVPVSTRDEDVIVRALFIYGTSSWKTGWNWLINGYGMMGMVTNDRVYDAVGYGGLAHTPGLSYGRGIGAYFIEYDPISGIYASPRPPGGPLFNSLFGDPGQVVCCFVHDYSLGALVIKDGLPGEIWYHNRYDITEDGTLVGHTGNEPQQIRGAGSFYAISNYISNTLTTFTWDGMGSISNVGSTPVGIGPEGIDVTLLGDASPLVVSTGSDVDYTLSHYSISGSHLKSVVYNAPASCTGPRYAVFIGQDPWLYIALSCHDSGTVEIIKVDLTDFQ